MTDDLLIDDQEITVALQNENIWKEFHDNATEMLVTRPGRQLFPKLAFKISGLDEKAQYKVTVIITRSDNLKYRYRVGKWQKECESDEEVGKCGNVVYHLRGIEQTGEEWMRGVTDFGHFKITNDKERSDHHMVFVQANHKYTPYVYIVDSQDHVILLQPLEMTSFLTVTTYNNPAIKQLKVVHNGFAKNHTKNYQVISSRKRPLEDSHPLQSHPHPSTITPPVFTSPLFPTPPQTPTLNSIVHDRLFPNPLIFNSLLPISDTSQFQYHSDHDAYPQYYRNFLHSVTPQRPDYTTNSTGDVFAQAQAEIFDDHELLQFLGI